MSTEQLIISLGTILLATRLFGFLFQRIHQPRVIGEMVAGIFLGPSLLGRFFPSFFAYVFPTSTQPILIALSQLGLILFMFIVGLEVDLKLIVQQGFAVVLTSNLSILVPLALGMGFAATIYPQLAGQGVAFSSFALFMGTAMSITAFPVLARILKERKLLSTELAAVAVSCAAVDDVTAWLLLAILTAMVHSAQSWPRFAVSLICLLAFMIMMLIPVRRVMMFIETYYKGNSSEEGIFFGLILFMFVSSWTTDKLGLHPLFGAFLAGLMVPKRHGLAARTIQRIEPLTLALLLPLFFALVGLRTRIDLLHEGRLGGQAIAIIGIAVLGKLSGAALGGRLTGMGWRNSLALGVLMNTRGLVELVVLNAGLELGILSPALFTMMVIMALVTTFMATPLLDLLKITGQQKQAAFVQQ